MKRWKQIILAEILLVIILLSIDRSFIIAFISIIIHEFTHIFIARYKGSKYDNLQFHIYGSRVELMDLEELNNKDKLLIYLSGPLANIMIICIAAIFYVHNKNNIFETVINLNLGLVIFNLLPAYPLDGARVAEIILSKKMSYKRAQGIISLISYIIATFFIVESILICIVLKQFNISMLLAGMVIIFITTSEKKAVMYILMGNIFKKKRNLIKNNYIENRILSVYYKQGLVNLMTMIDKNRFNSFYVLNDDMKLLFIIHEDELIEAVKEYGNMILEEYEKVRKEVN